MSESSLVFDPAGRVRGLYTEAIDLQALGPLRIERASTVEFDQQAQRWQVRDTGGRLLHRAPSRQDCLDWERRYFNQR